MKYRSRTDIVGQILDVAREPITKTKIMYGAYLSYQQLTEYLGVLLENGLIEYEEGRQTYKTTQKGLVFLKSCNHIGSMITSNTPLKRTRHE